jgi:hypothetical protein
MDDAALAEWLRLREDADRRARAVAITRAAVAALPNNRPLRILDLGTGSGANVRYLIEELHARQQWLVIDRSATLLAEFGTRMIAWAHTRGYTAQAVNGHMHIRGEHLDCAIELRQQDLNVIDDAVFKERDLVTGSALLDLVSEGWMRTAAARCRAAGAVALFTISYDGRSSCTPAEPEDEIVRWRLNEHQLRDKGLGGPAVGPDAAACGIDAFTEHGYRVISAPSDWMLAPSESAMQRMLIDGWVRAATELATDDESRILSWRMRRLAHLDAATSHVTVGHVDFAALP